MATSCNINFNGYSISDWKGQKTEGLFDKLKREKREKRAKNELTIHAFIGNDYEQQYFDECKCIWKNYVPQAGQADKL